MSIRYFLTCHNFSSISQCAQSLVTITMILNMVKNYGKGSLVLFTNFEWRDLTLILRSLKCKCLAYLSLIKQVQFVCDNIKDGLHFAHLKVTTNWNLHSLQFRWAFPSDAWVSWFGNFKYWAVIRNGTKELVAGSQGGFFNIGNHSSQELEKQVLIRQPRFSIM